MCIRDSRFTIVSPGGKPRTKYSSSWTEVQGWIKMVKKHRKNGGQNTACHSALNTSTNRYQKKTRIGWRKGKMSK